MLEDCTPKLVFYHSLQESLIQGQQGGFVRLDSEYAEIVEGKTSTDKCKIIQADEGINTGATDGGASASGTASAEMLEHDPCLIIYTGGTTGKPKGVVLTHGNLFWNSVNTILSWGLSSTDVTLTYMPLFHTGGINALSLPLLHCGGTVVIGREFNTEKTIRIINKEKCTIVLMVPTMYHMLIESEAFQQSQFPSMQTFLSGGAPCPLNIYQAFEERGFAFKEGYGLTEAGPNNFYIAPERSQKKRGSVGRPMFYNQIKLADDQGNAVEAGDVGEILIQGGHVFSHYWNNEQATKETIVDGWLKTGDLGLQDEDGDFYIIGRKKDMIITGGENVYPLEIEHLIGQHPAVKEVAVVGLPDVKWGEIVTAVLVLQEGAKLTEEEVKEYCFKKIGRYKVPKRIIITSVLPKTPVGKINKKEIKSFYSASDLCIYL